MILDERMAPRLLGLRRVAPRSIAHMYTSVFSTTRRAGMVPDDVCPLGACRVGLEGLARVRSAYVWGDDAPGVLALHGWASDSTAMLGIVEQSRQHGVSAVCFDAPGHGVSPGSQATLMEYSVAATEMLRRNPGVHTIVSHSLGSIIAAAAVANLASSRVRTIVMLAPACTLSGVLERWAGDRELPRDLVEGMYRELHRRNGVPVSHWDIRTLGLPPSVRVHILHDPDDDWTPISETYEITAALSQATMAPVTGVGHYGIVGSAVARATVSDYLQSMLEVSIGDD